MISSRKEACARALFFFFLHPLHRVFSCPLRQTRSGFFRQAFCLSYPSLILSRTRDRPSASEILLSILVAVDRLTSFGSVQRRCTKAPRKQPMGGIESSASKRIPDELEPWAAPPFSSSLDRTLPSQTLLHRALLGK